MKDQTANFLPDLAPSRRAFLSGTVATGLALAARPASASQITTSSDGLEAGTMQVPVPDGTIPGYYARPKGRRDAPVVLVVQEIFGLHAHIQDVCRRLAQAGCFAVSVELYARQGDVTKLEGIPAILEVVRTVPDAQVMADLDAARAWAGKEGGNIDKLGITGFCWGGRVVWLYAAHQPALKAGVAWYGRLKGEPSALTPTHPLDVVAKLQAPVLGLYGRDDTGIPVTDVEAMRSALEAAGKPGELVIYDGVGHAFHADYRPSYDASAAHAGWKRLLAWLAEHGVA